MNINAILIAAHFILLHGPGGQEITLNVGEISSIRQPRGEAEGHFAEDVKCLVTMTNGKWHGVVESCLDVIKQIAEIEVPP